MEITRKLVGEAARVKLGSVHKAVSSGRWDMGDLRSIAGYVVIGRMSSGGLGGGTGLSPDPGLDDDGSVKAKEGL